MRPIQSVPTLRRRPHARRWTAKRRFAQRLPRDVTVNEPGGLVQLDTVHLNIAPDKASNTSLHTTDRQLRGE
jgi:putative transposase